jgi:hypothetical protein
LLGRVIGYWRGRGGMTPAELAMHLIRHGYVDAGFTTPGDLAGHLERMEAGDPWSLGESTHQRLFADCMGRCFGPDARVDVGIGLADDHLRRVFPGDDLGLAPITPDR